MVYFYFSLGEAAVFCFIFRTFLTSEYVLAHKTFKYDKHEKSKYSVIKLEQIIFKSHPIRNTWIKSSVCYLSFV